MLSFSRLLDRRKTSRSKRRARSVERDKRTMCTISLQFSDDWLVSLTVKCVGLRAFCIPHHHLYDIQTYVIDLLCRADVY